MSLTPQELERRRHFLTASDVPAILGKSPWNNAADVFLAKVAGLVPKTNAAMEAGSLLEPKVLEWAESRLGPILPGDWRVHDNGINAASLDGMTADGEIVEAKTSGIVGPGNPRDWGEEGTDEIPEYYLAQVYAQLLVTGARRAWVPALIGGRGFVLYCVWPNERALAAIEAVSVQFWTGCVLAKEPPPKQFASIETLTRLRREPGKAVEIPDEFAREFLAAKEQANAAGKAEERAKSQLLSALGDAEVGRWSGGEFTFREQTRKGYTVEDCTFRVLRSKAAKPKATKLEAIEVAS